MEEIILNITGMSCNHCKETVTRTISGFSGVNNVKVDLQKGTASFTYNNSRELLEKIKAAIVDEGFDVTA